MGLGTTDEEIRAIGRSEKHVCTNQISPTTRRAKYLESLQPPTNCTQQGLCTSQPISINSTPPTPTTSTSAMAKAPKAGSVWMVIRKKINP